MTDWLDELDALERRCTPTPWWKSGKYQLYGPTSDKKKEWEKNNDFKPSKGEKIVQARANQNYRWYPDQQDSDDVELMALLRNHARELIDIAKKELK